MDHSNNGSTPSIRRGKPTKMTGEERRDFNKKLRKIAWLATSCMLPFILLIPFLKKSPAKEQVLLAVALYLLVVWSLFWCLKKPRQPILKE